MKNKVKIIASIVLTLFFVGYVTVKIDWRIFLKVIEGLNSSMLFAASLVYFISYYFRALRLKLLVGDPSIKTTKLLGINFLHNFYNRIIPARLGDFSLIYLLKKLNKNSINSSVNVFMFVKLYDLLISVLLLAVSYTVLYHFNFMSISIWIVTVFLFGLALKPSVFLCYLQKITAKLSYWKYIRKVDKELAALIDNSKKIETNYLRICLFFTSLGIWLLIFVLFYLLFLSIYQEYEIWDTLFATTLANFSWVLPINGVGGFGTMEASMGFAFSMRGYSFHDTLIHSLYINVIVFLLSALFAIIPYFKFIKRGNESETNHSNPMSK